MYSKMPVLIILAVLLLTAWYGFSKRRDMPFQEIVPLDMGIAVVNAEKWYIDNLQVQLRDDSGRVERKRFNPIGECVFPGLVNDKPYIVEIKRTDIKGMILYKNLKVSVSPRKGGSKYIVLLGASIGKSWDFPHIGSRINPGNEYVFGNRTVYRFEKDEQINDLVSLSIPVSHVIIKECSAYFPRDVNQSLLQIKSWVAKLQSIGIKPILSTVVPVTEAKDDGSPGKLDSIVKYNNSIRKYGKNSGIPVLDLEKALRLSEDNRHLRGEYAQEDGTHLIKKAYDEVLDPLFLSLLKGRMTGNNL